MAKATKTKTKAPTYGARNKPKAKAEKPAAKKAFPLVGKTDLNRLLDRCFDYQNRASTATGAMGELVREYAETKHLHPGAFALIRRLHRLGSKDPGKLWLLLAHFDDMREKAAIDQLAKKQGQLLPALADEGEEEAGPQPPVGENVVTYPREVTEQAGEHAA